MAPIWRVVGGESKNRGGILVRTGIELSSPQTPERLANGSLVEEVALNGDRLHYKLFRGNGPPEGWVSLKLKGKQLLILEEEEEEDEDVGGPGGDETPAEVDEELKASIEAECKERQPQGLFEAYLPKYEALESPRLRLLCFHCEGAAESSYTRPGTALAEWIRESRAVELCAFNYPGRAKLLGAQRHTAAGALARDLLTVFYEKMCEGVPYMVWAHSVGTWVAFEYLILSRKLGLPMPRAAFFVAFPAPHLPPKLRRWRKRSELNPQSLREEMLSWDSEHFLGTGQVIFEMPAWEQSFEPLIRGDFELFRTYSFSHAGSPKFNFPIHTWHASRDRLVTPAMLAQWKEWTTGSFEIHVLEGMGHLTCIFEHDQAMEYFKRVTDLMKTYFAL